MSVLVAPSIISADFCNLSSDFEMINRSEADWVHIDIMDGIFVPNITFGMPVVRQLRPLTNKPFDVHLMIHQPERYLSQFRDAGADILTVHYEGVLHLHRTISQIKELGVKAGVAINPHTPVEHLFDILDEVDLVLIMSVNPGFGGQKFIPNSFNKIERLSDERIRRGKEFIIQVDGGVDSTNATQLVQRGVDCLVAGNYIFKSANPIEAVQALKSTF